MNADILLAHYERIADAPDAIARLRRFVLDLAVRGKLVPQDADDEPASELLRRLTKDDSKRQAQSRRVAAADDQPQYNLPPTWAWARIGDHLDLVNGSAFKPSDWRAEGLPIVRIQNLNRPDAPFNHCDPRGVRDRFKIDSGALLISWSGTPGTSFGAFIWERGPAVLNQHIFRCDFKLTAFDKQFLRLAINGRLDEMIEKAHGGVGLQHITKGKLEDLPISLPPLAEQHRIVAKVDELMALCDRLEAARAEREAKRDRLTAASLARLDTPDPDSFRDDARFALAALPSLTTRPDQIKRLRQTILNLAVRGKLVPQDPNDEPAHQLLTKIEKHKAELASTGRGRSEGRVGRLAEGSLTFQLPQGWVAATLGDITISRDAERVPVSREERQRRQPIYDYYGASGVIDKIDGYLFDKPLLLVGEDGANLINRSSPIAFIARGRYWVNNHAHVLDGISEGMLQFLEMFMNAIDLRPFVTGTAQPKMNQAKMCSIPVPLPPLAEQHRIVAKVDELMALCDRLEASLTTATSARSRLLEATLREALRPAEPPLLEAAE